MQTWHEFDHEGKHFRLVWDEDHQTRGSYALDTEEAIQAAEDEEIEKLESGEWVVLGCIVTRSCKGETRSSMDGPEVSHCEACSGTVQVDSLWGSVIENSTEKAESYFKEVCGQE